VRVVAPSSDVAILMEVLERDDAKGFPYDREPGTRRGIGPKANLKVAASGKMQLSWHAMSTLAHSLIHTNHMKTVSYLNQINSQNLNLMPRVHVIWPSFQLHCPRFS
jgi:hypothetical protein